MDDAFSHPLKALKAALRGPKLEGPMAPELPFDYPADAGAEPLPPTHGRGDRIVGRR